jgi:hypothetical protein
MRGYEAWQRLLNNMVNESELPYVRIVRRALLELIANKRSMTNVGERYYPPNPGTSPVIGL